MKARWTTKRLEECIVLREQPRRIQRAQFLSSGAFPVVSQEAEFTNGFWDEDADVLKVDTPLVIFGDHTRVIKYVDFDFVVGADGVKVLQPREFLAPRFLYYQLLLAELPSKGYARHFRYLRELDIHFPAYSEQRRIVALLDEAFAGLATAAANAERNLDNARELFESHLAEVFSRRGDGWVERRLGELCEILDSRRKPITKRDRVPGPIPYYGATGIQDHVRDFIFDEALVLVGEDGAKWASGERTAFAVDGKCWVNNHAHVLRPRRDQICDYWLIAYLMHLDLTAFVSGLTVPKLTQASLRDIPIPVPPLSEQMKLARTAARLEEQSQRLVGLYEQKQSALAALKRSLVHQAFNGEL